MANSFGATEDIDSIQRVPLLQSLDIEGFTTAVLDGKGMYVKNCIIERYPSGTEYSTQRPTVGVYEDASDTVSKIKARGLYYWDAVNALYIVNDDTVYKNTYSTAVTNTITSGTDRVYMNELGIYLFLIDEQDNKGYYISSAATTTLVVINAGVDGDFPPNAGLTLAAGVAVLDNYAFVLDTNGTIWQSGNNTVLTWDALEFINAEREEDGGVYIGKHKDHIVVLGTRTIEFFQNVGNPNASTLQRRDDLSYRIGAVDGNGVWETEDNIFFLGIEPTGNVGLWKMENYQLEKVSTNQIDTFLTDAKAASSYTILVSGQHLNGHECVFVTIYWLDGNGDPHELITLVYNKDKDDKANHWAEWTTTILDQTKFPVVGTAIRTGTSVRTSEGIFLNGDLYKALNNLGARDETVSSLYVDVDYTTPDTYITTGTDTTASVALNIRTENIDFGYYRNKFQSNLELIGDHPSSTTNVTVKWTDDDYKTWKNNRTIDMSKTRRKLTRGGYFNRRAYDISYAGDNKLKLEALEIVVDLGNI